MIDNDENNILSIIKSSKDSLIIKNKDIKFVCKTYDLQKKQIAVSMYRQSLSQIAIKLVQPLGSVNGIISQENSLIKFRQQVQQTINNLQIRQRLNHNNLIQFSLSPQIIKISQFKYSISIVHQHFCKILQQCLFYKYQEIDFDDQEIINTFEPILQVVEYLIKQNCPIHQFSTKNIVITENQTVKFIYSFLLNNSIQILSSSKQSAKQSIKQNIYQQIASTIFQIILPTQTSKSWKNRLKLLKQKRSKQICLFLSIILKKSPIKCVDSKKQKKIKKSFKGQKITKVNKKLNIQDLINSCHKDENKNIIDSISSIKHQGKQNKLHQ